MAHEMLQITLSCDIASAADHVGEGFCYGPNFCSFPAWARDSNMTLVAGIVPIEPEAQSCSENARTPSPVVNLE